MAGRVERRNGGKKRGEGGGGVKKERKQNNWFCRLLERVQTGHREPRSATRVHGIESAAFRVLDFSTASSKTEKKERKLHLEMFTGTFHTRVLFFFVPTICYHYYYHKKSVLAFEMLWSELPLIVP